MRVSDHAAQSPPTMRTAGTPSLPAENSRFPLQEGRTAGGDCATREGMRSKRLRQKGFSTILVLGLLAAMMAMLAVNMAALRQTGRQIEALEKRQNARWENRGVTVKDGAAKRKPDKPKVDPKAGRKK